MEIKQNFVVSQPLPAVWSFFHDVPGVAKCLPGAEYLGTKDDGSIGGKVSAKVGPFQASFEGEAKVKYDEDAKKVVLKLEVPGIDEKDLDIRVENNTLTVKGERKFEKEEKEENFQTCARP